MVAIGGARLRLSKTRTAVEELCRLVNAGYKHIGIMGRTMAEVKRVVVRGPSSGLLAVAPLRGLQPKDFKPNHIEVTFKNSDATIYLFSAEEPDSVRGMEFDAFLCDELAAYRKAEEALYNIDFALRIKHPDRDPKLILATTPRSLKWLKELRDDPEVHVSSGSSLENSEHLAGSALDKAKRRGKSKLALQEVYGEIVEDLEGALWSSSYFKYEGDLDKTQYPSGVPQEMDRIVLALDPATTASTKSDFTAISIVGIKGEDLFVLHSEQLKVSPAEWAARVDYLYHSYQVDRVIAERNQGGSMVEHTLRTVNPHISLETVHAKVGKRTRAEPVASLYELGRVYHIGDHTDLEDQLVQFGTPALEHDDLTDSICYAITALTQQPIEEPAPFMTFRRPRF